MAKKTDNEHLDLVILNYQKARDSNDDLSIQYYYDEILKYYNPMNFKNVWWKKYGWIYDFDSDEFDGDYRAKFIDCINKYIPSSKTGKKITLNNYFYSAIEKMYAGIVIKVNTAKRNPSQVCPICSKITSNISSHVREEHKDIVWSKLIELGMNEEKGFVGGCPFCPKHLPKKKCDSNDKNDIVNHISKYHSTILFDQFKDMFPHMYIGNNHIKNMSEYNLVDNDDFDIIDFIENNSSNNYINNFDIMSNLSKSESMANFVNSEKTELENLIIEFIFDSRIKNIDGGTMNHRQLNNWLNKKRDQSNSTDLRVSKKDFDYAIRMLKDKMLSSGLA